MRIELGVGVVSSFNNQKSAPGVFTLRHSLPETQAAPCTLCESALFRYTEKYLTQPEQC